MMWVFDIRSYIYTICFPDVLGYTDFFSCRAVATRTTRSGIQVCGATGTDPFVECGHTLGSDCIANDAARIYAFPARDTKPEMKGPCGGDRLRRIRPNICREGY